MTHSTCPQLVNCDVLPTHNNLQIQTPNGQYLLLMNDPHPNKPS